jgi:hypothetical protein
MIMKIADKYGFYRIVFVILSFLFISSCHMDEYHFPLIPVVKTSVPVDITNVSATCGGDVTADFGYKVLFRGICWSVIHTPTIADSISLGSFKFEGSCLGKFTSTMSGLNSSTTYYIRAYAVNANGVGYGKTLSFTTGISTTNIK